MMNEGKKKKLSGMTIWRMFMVAWSFFMLYFGDIMNVYASDYGKKAGTWMLDQIFWIGVVALAIALMSCLLKKAWVAAIITLLAGGLILFFIKSPTTAVEIATNIYQAIFG